MNESHIHETHRFAVVSVGHRDRKSETSPIILEENTMYLWERADWPNLTWRDGHVALRLADVRHKQKRLNDRMAELDFEIREEAELQILTLDVVKTSEIEGEYLNPALVRSSLARRMGIDIDAKVPIDRDIEGIVEITIDAARNHDAPLTAERLFGWHKALFPSGRSGISRIRVGDWRDDAHGPMRVVSGPFGRERVHYIAPPAERVGAEMEAFLAWFNAPTSIDPVVKAALAHLWFVIIHPFADGNGRIGRAIGDMAISTAGDGPRRFYTMSHQIKNKHGEYYDELKRAQGVNMDITPWILWFTECHARAIDHANEILDSSISNRRFRNRIDEMRLNERQSKMLNRLLDGFQGKMTSTKWAKIAKCPEDEADRDIAALIDFGLLREGKGDGPKMDYEIVREPPARDRLPSSEQSSIPRHQTEKTAGRGFEGDSR